MINNKRGTNNMAKRRKNSNDYKFNYNEYDYSYEKEHRALKRNKRMRDKQIHDRE